MLYDFNNHHFDRGKVLKFLDSPSRSYLGFNTCHSPQGANYWYSISKIGHTEESRRWLQNVISEYDNANPSRLTKDSDLKEGDWAVCVEGSRSFTVGKAYQLREDLESCFVKVELDDRGSTINGRRLKFFRKANHWEIPREKDNSVEEYRKSVEKAYNGKSGKYCNVEVQLWQTGYWNRYQHRSPNWKWNNHNYRIIPNFIDPDELARRKEIENAWNGLFGKKSNIESLITGNECWRRRTPDWDWKYVDYRVAETAQTNEVTDVFEKFKQELTKETKMSVTAGHKKLVDRIAKGGNTLFKYDNFSQKLVMDDGTVAEYTSVSIAGKLAYQSIPGFEQTKTGKISDFAKKWSFLAAKYLAWKPLNYLVLSTFFDISKFCITKARYALFISGVVGGSVYAFNPEFAGEIAKIVIGTLKSFV